MAKAAKGSRPAARAAPAELADGERERIHRSFLALALAHELKQPLNALALNSDLLGRRLQRIGPPAAECTTPLEAISRVVDRVNSCLESFLVHVAPERAPDEAADVRPMLRRALDRIRPVAARLQVRLVDEIGEVPPAAIHPVQLEVAIDALLENAVRACRRGAAVTLRARLDDEDLRLEVQDEGEGMAPDILRRAVEIGYSRWGRPGIGLAVVKFIAYAHGGGFQIESNSDHGTRVSLVLPV